MECLNENAERTGKHLPLSLMNRLNQTESAAFKLWMLCFQRISFQIMVDCGWKGYIAQGKSSLPPGLILYLFTPLEELQ